MKMRLDVLPFPMGAESNGFISALASAITCCRGVSEDDPYWCAQKGRYCVRCGDCGQTSQLRNHRGMLYHELLTVSGLAFTFDYPEDDNVGFHTMPDTPVGWRWEEPFVAELMDFAGFGYERYARGGASDMHGVIARAIDSGYPALVAKHGKWADGMEWARCWSVVCGYTDNGICVMRHGGEIAVETEGAYDDWIVITGPAMRARTYRDALRRICRILTDPSHDAIEREIYTGLDNVTPDNAEATAYKLMGINGVPIETRWHAGEALCSPHNMLWNMCADEALRTRVRELIFPRYIDGDGCDTHAAGWKIWGALNVGPHSGYMPTEESFALIQKEKVRQELKRLYRIIFDNDRAVAKGLCELLD